MSHDLYYIQLTPEIVPIHYLLLANYRLWNSSLVLRFSENIVKGLCVIKMLIVSLFYLLGTILMLKQKPGCLFSFNWVFVCHNVMDLDCGQEPYRYSRWLYPLIVNHFSIGNCFCKLLY